jgi:hypothetical protein
MDMPPSPPPTRIQPVKAPLRRMRCSVKVMAMAMAEATEIPRMMVPIHSA